MVALGVVQRIEDSAALRRICTEHRRRGERVALVPTMGALHEGHRALLRQARREADCVVCSIFVNPLQFSVAEDLQRYPRDLASDLAVLKEQSVDLAFVPLQGVFVEGLATRVSAGALSARWEGEHRPGHFDGVATIVTKLLSIVGDCLAYFGQKDYQQLRVVEQLVADLSLPTELRRVATVRDKDGLALSSRNSRLSPRGRERALALSAALGAVTRRWQQGERHASALREAACGILAGRVDRIDYLALADPGSLEPFAERCGSPCWVAVAGVVEGVRLIDNTIVA